MGMSDCVKSHSQHVSPTYGVWNSNVRGVLDLAQGDFSHGLTVHPDFCGRHGTKGAFVFTPFSPS
jgi:hypothetical protein